MRRLAALLVLLPAIALAAPATEDETAIREIVDRQVRAWNAGDAKAYSERFAPEGSFTNIVGMVAYGPGAFEDRHREIFAGIFRGSRLKQTIRRLRFVTPDVAIADIDAELEGFAGLPPGVQKQPDGSLRTRLMQVFVKRDGAWWIEAYHNVDAKVVPQAR